jgi:hypothetical protein
MTGGYEIRVSTDILQVQLISGLNLKQLQRLIVILSCLFLLPFVYEGVQGELSPPGDSVQVLTYHGVHHAACPNAHYRTATIRKFSYRNRAVIDHTEFFLTVYGTRIKPLFVYIHPNYKGFTESYISVSNSLSDWRGPPVA